MLVFVFLAAVYLESCYLTCPQSECSRSSSIAWLSNGSLIKVFCGGLVGRVPGSILGATRFSEK
jgi:hypothetical protein